MDVLVVGCGVAGLTCGVRLLEAGFTTRIVTRELPLQTTSAVAAAIWYPYLVEPEERVLPWAERTLAVYEGLADEPAAGVSQTTLLVLFDHPVPDPPWLRVVPRFRRPRREELPEAYEDGFVVEVPLIETPVHLSWLLERFRVLGGEVERRPQGVASLAEVARRGRLVVHATGVGARELARDPEVVPVRGQVVRVTNPGLSRALADDEGPLALAYVVPRGRDVVLGGTAEEGVWDLSPDPVTREEILAKATRLEPRLAGAEVLETQVGLRPGRREVRLELEEVGGATVIHDYGHGGAGFTLCWGCAEEVVELARRWRG